MMAQLLQAAGKGLALDVCEQQAQLFERARSFDSVAPDASDAGVFDRVPTSINDSIKGRSAHVSLIFDRRRSGGVVQFNAAAGAVSRRVCEQEVVELFFKVAIELFCAITCTANECADTSVNTGPLFSSPFATIFLSFWGSLPATYGCILLGRIFWLTEIFFARSFHFVAVFCAVFAGVVRVFFEEAGMARISCLLVFAIAAPAVLANLFAVSVKPSFSICLSAGLFLFFGTHVLQHNKTQHVTQQKEVS